MARRKNSLTQFKGIDLEGDNEKVLEQVECPQATMKREVVCADVFAAMYDHTAPMLNESSPANEIDNDIPVARGDAKGCLLELIARTDISTGTCGRRRAVRVAKERGEGTTKHAAEGRMQKDEPQCPGRRSARRSPRRRSSPR